MNQRERKKRTAKTESAVKTVEKAETVKVEQTKKAVVKAAKAEKEGRNNWCGQRVGSGRVVQVGNMNLHESFTRTEECTRIWRVPMHDQKS